MKRARRLGQKALTTSGFWIALVGAGLVFIYPLGAEVKKPRANKAQGVQLKGVPVKAVGSAVVDFQKLAARQRSTPLVREAVPYAAPEPGEFEDSVNDKIKGEPAPSVSVDIPGPHIPSPSPANSFAALDDIAFAPPGTAFFTIPPDTIGAVGTDAVNKVMVTLNNNYRILNKTTGAQIGSDVSMVNFWAPVGATNPFDPRVQYDPYNDRWIVAGVSDASSATTSILVGVSTTSDPGGTYSLFKVPARVAGDPAATNFADFPMLGFNKNWVVVSINMFSSVFVDGRSLVIDYPTLRTGTLSSMYFTGVTSANAGFCMHPATTYSATEATEYLVAHLSSAGATYRMHTITGTSAAPVFTLGVTKTRPGGGWTQPSGNILPQSTAGSLGTCATASAALSKMEASDAQVRSNVVFRNSSIWYPQTIGLPAGGLTHTAAQWTQLNTSGDVIQGGRVEDPTATATNGGKWYAYASIAVNSSDDVLFGFSQFSSAQFASAGYTYRDHTDGAGTMRDPFIFKAGEDCYSKDFSSGRNRWGDYSHTMVDPTGDCSLWTIDEYAKLSAPPTLGGSDSKWGTWWARVDALSCGAVTPTPTNTPTFTPTPIPPTATFTPTLTPVPPTVTFTPTRTPTQTPVPPTATFTPTLTPVPPTATFTPTQTPVPPTATFTPTLTTVPPTATFTPTATPVPPTATFTPTLTPVPPTATFTPTRTPTQTPVPPTATFTPTLTPVPPTATFTPTQTPVPPTATFTPTLTPVPPTATFTPTATSVPPTATFTPTLTPVPPTASFTPTRTPTQTPVPPTATFTPTLTPVPPTSTFTPTLTPVPPTATFTPSPTPVPPTATFTPTLTPVPPTATFTPTQTAPPTTTFTPTLTPVPPTFTPTRTPTPTVTPSPSNTPTLTFTPTLPPPTFTPTRTPTPLPGLRFYTLTPCRVIDTRGPVGAYGGPALIAGADRTFIFGGQCGIPPTAVAIALNVVAVQPTDGPGYFTLFPGGTLQPLAATINYNLGIIRANNAIIPMGTLKDITVHCQQGTGTANTVIDVNGYFAP